MLALLGVALLWGGVGALGALVCGTWLSFLLGILRPSPFPLAQILINVLG